MAQTSDAMRGTTGGLRRGLMLYGSTAAMAAALMLAEGGIGPAFAQEIGPRISPTEAAQGSFTVPGPSPSPTFEYRSSNLDIVHMNRDAVLNWTAYDTAAPGGANGTSYVNFLPEGTELRFVGNGESFTAINRVFTTPDAAGNYRGIAFQGRVTSYLFGDGPSSTGPVGGNIWFFSPGGILATGSASFNVGSLLLSASDLDNFNEQGFGRSVDFTGVADPFASVILKPGARVILTQPQSSFAIVAPTIEQGGEVTVDGSALYLSAETGALYFDNDGTIFSSIFSDAASGNEIRHLGTTTGPASVGTDDFEVFDPQTIEFRTGQDVRLLLSGTVGYAAATDATLSSNGSIVLSAGAVSAGDLTLTSSTSIEAAEAEFTVTAGESLTMGSDANGAYSLFVEAREGMLTAGAGGVIDIAGDVTFRSPNQRGTFVISAAGADANDNPGGRISVGDNLIVDASVGRFGASSDYEGGRAEVTIGDGGSLRVGGAMSLLADAYASETEGGTAALGGRAVLAMTGVGASLEVGRGLTISAQALPFAGNCDCYPPPSGTGTGGYAAFTATGGTIDTGFVNVSASAEAYRSYYSYGNVGANLDATGGIALVDLGDSAASVSSISVSADALGANGGNDTAGGSAFGGTATFRKDAGGSFFTQGINVSADANAGDGSNAGYTSQSATHGGDAAGGTASITLGQNAEGLGYLDLSARARAGHGGSAIEYSAQSGGDGGDARGGTARLTLSGEGTRLAGVVEGSLNVSATGGSGGDGEADYTNGFAGGSGGAGGLGQGGNLLITAADGAEFSWEQSFAVTGNGGSGGHGGNSILGEGGVSEPGKGGAGGDAIGASVSIIADGGLISGDLELDVRSYGGEGGFDGSDEDGNFTGAAGSGVSRGGSISLTASENGVSGFDIGYAELYASGDVAGAIAIADESTDPAAAMRFGSLYAEAYGDADGMTPTLRLSAAGNAISVDGTAEFYANSIGLDFTGSGRLEVGGFTFLSTSGGDIGITHVDNPGVLSLHSTGPIEVYADGDYTAALGSVVAGGDYALIRATGALAAADTRGLGSVVMYAQGDATVGNVAAGWDFELAAGRLEFDGGYAFQPSARATITGTVTAGGSVLVESGGFAEFAAGSRVLSDNDIRVRTGDDIIVASGASLVSDIDPADLASIHLLAGDINFGPFEGDLIEPIATPIASLRIGGGLETNGAALYLSGDAIDASGSTISTGNLTVDVTDTPPFGPFSSDGGLLTAGCHQGSACLGDIAATGDVAIGLASDLISLRTGAIDFTGDEFAAVTSDRLELNGGTLAAGGGIFLRSVNDVVALSAITLEAPDIRLLAGTDLAAGSATLISIGAVGIEVGNDIAVGTIVAGNGLDDGSESASFSAPGNFTVGSLTYGGGTPMQISAGGDMLIGFADPGGSGIDLAADGSLFLGSTAATSGTIALAAEAVSFDNLRSIGTVGISAGEGGIAGVSNSGAAIEAGGAIALDALGDIALGELIAGAGIAISGATVSGVGITAGGELSVAAEGGVAVGSFGTGGDVTFTGRSLALGAGSAGGNLVAEATGGSLDFTALGAAGDATLAGSAAITGGDVTSGGRLALSAASLALGTGTGATGVSALVANGASFARLASSAGSVDLVAGGAIGGGTVSAATNVAIGGASLAIDSVTAGGDVALNLGTLSSGQFTAGGTFRGQVTGAAQFARATAGGDAIVAAQSIDAERMTAGRDLDVTVAGSLALDAFTAGRNALLRGSGLTLVNGSAGGALSAEAVSGDLAFTQLSAGGNGSLRGAGTLSGGTVVATGTLTLSGAGLGLTAASGAAGLVATSSGAAAFGMLGSANGAVSLDAGGAVSGGSASAAGAITLAGSSVTLGSATFGAGLSLTARTGALGGSGLYQGSGTATLAAAQGIAVGSVDTLGAIALTAGGDARFVELRSRDGAVGVNAAGAILGSSAAALGSDPAGEDGVSLVAGGSISLDGATSTLNPFSSAQDDFTARAGGTIVIARAQAGRDLSLDAGAGTVGGANLVAGRDLLLSGPSVDLGAATVARNLRVRATAGNVTGSGLTTAGGAIDLGASGAIAVGSLRANGGALVLTAGGAVGSEALAASNGVTVGGTAFALGDVTADAGDVRLEAASGALSAGAVSGANIRVVALGAVSLGGVSAHRDAQLSGVSLTLSSASTGGNLTLESGAAGGIVSGALSAGGNLSVEAGAQGFAGTGLTAMGGLELASAGGIAFTSASAATSLDFDATGAIGGGAVSAGNLATLDAGGTITLSGLTASNAALRTTGGAVAASGIQIGGLLDAAGTALTLAAPGALRVDARASAGAIGITAGGDLRVNATAPGNISLASTGGSVLIGSVAQSTTEPGGIGAQAVGGGGAVAVTAANAISVADSLSAGGALGMTAGGLVSLSGAATGQTIDLRAGDLVIGTAGSLGTAGTQRISLASSGPINLGAGASGGFAVDAAEFGRIQSGGDLLITALAGTTTGAGSITLGSLTINAGSGGQIGTSGTFGLTANGVLDINSVLSIGRASGGNTLMLTGDAVDLDYANAALSVLDSANASAGRIVVNGRLITSLSASAAADIVGKTPDQINARLGLADVVREIGLFRTANLTLQGQDAILIQNSGGAAVDERRGLSVGALTVTGAPDGHTLVVINGIVNNATGTGAAQNVTLTTPIAPGSTVNGCALANIAGCVVVAEPPAPLIEAPGSILFGTSDMIKDEEESEEVEQGAADGDTDAPPIDTTRIDDPAGQPMIDDPVTGAGNEDLWQPPDG